MVVLFCSIKLELMFSILFRRVIMPCQWNEDDKNNQNQQSYYSRYMMPNETVLPVMISRSGVKYLNHASGTISEPSNILAKVRSWAINKIKIEQDH